jgi:long-subunit acyl-CoA synthetase (AMP-forming)
MFVSGSAPIPPPLVIRAKERLHAEVIPCWGMTEVAAVPTGHLGDADEKVFGSDGDAVPHTSVMVVDANDRPLPVDTPGQA